MRVAWLLIGVLLAACGSPAAPSVVTQSTVAGTPSGLQSTAAQGGGGEARGYDCATLLTPLELDQSSGLTGGTVTTNHRGDQPSAGEVPGVTECGIDIPTVSDWSGSFHVYSGAEALANFDSEMGVNGYARGNGVALDIGVAWDEESTTEQAVKDAVKQILATVLSRT
jgi:hypothetical protein